MQAIAALSPDALHRAVAPVDYCAIADRLEWVQQAGARFRWTGCWQTGFITPDLRLRGDGTHEGYFGADSFTFGMPLHRLTLEAVIGAVPGVLGVRDITIAARGIHHPQKLTAVYRVPDNRIRRLANDPRTPERGSIKVYTEGGV